jgi:cytochrome P450
MVKYNPFDAEVQRGDTYEVYRRLRDEAPCYHIEEFDAWALSRFHDIWEASQDTEHYTATKGTTSSHVLTKVQPVTPMLNMMDPPEHTKLRKEIRNFFMPARARELEPWIRELAAECLDAKRDVGTIDVVDDFAAQVATKVACEVNGFPKEDGEHLTELVRRFFARDPEVDGMTEDGLAAMNELFTYFVGLTQQVRKESSETTVVKLLTEIELGGEKLDDMAIASHLSMLIIGGAETFPKVFANLIRRLGEYTDQRAECVADPSLIPDAFLEGLRYDMPTQFLCRTVTKEHQIHDQTLRPGQPILYLYPSANRDPREFDSPDTFDIHRRAPRILSFGHGTHSCIGLHVAKIEGKVCLEETLKRMPEFEVQMDRADRLITDFVQGYAKLPISFQPF